MAEPEPDSSASPDDTDQRASASAVLERQPTEAQRPTDRPLPWLRWWQVVAAIGVALLIGAAVLALGSSSSDTPSGRSDGLDTGEWLYPNDERRSADGRWILLLQADGNLVVEDNENADESPIWTSRTSGVPGARAVMQPDGNFVIYDYSTGENEGPVYSTNTAGNPGATLTIQNDGAVVIRSTSGAQLFNSAVSTASG